MKKIIAIVCALMCFWMMFSFLDVVSDNKSENPQHSDLNFFVLIAPEKEDTEPVGELLEVWAEVSAINHDGESISLTDENGEVWVAFADVELYEIGDEVMVVFDDMGTENWYDDEIVDLVKW